MQQPEGAVSEVSDPGRTSWNNPLAVKLWARKLFEEALKATWFAKFIGTTSSSLIQTKSETTKSAGDRITVGLRMQLTGTGVQGDATLEGQEEALTTYNDNLYIDQLRHAMQMAPSPAMAW